MGKKTNRYTGIDGIDFWSELDVQYRMRCTNTLKTALSVLKKRITDKRISVLSRKIDGRENISLFVATMDSGENYPKKLF